MRKHLQWIIPLAIWWVALAVLTGAHYQQTPTPLWDDMRVPASATQINPVSSKPDRGVFVGNVQTILFDDTSDECVNFAVQIPHGYKYGTNLRPHMHWSPTDATAGNVVWTEECWLAEVGAAFALVLSDSVTDAADGDAVHQIASWSEIDGSAIDSVSAMLQCQLCRDADNLADTYGSDAAFNEADFHYQTDQPGSFFELVK